MANVELLKQQLKDCIRIGEISHLKGVLSKIMGCCYQEVDMSFLLPDVVKLLAHSDLLVKKLAGDVLVQYGRDNAEVVIMAINTLIQDASESNPMIRGLALKTLSALHQDLVSEHLDGLVTKGLQDDSAYVRRAAVVACARLHHMSSSWLKTTGKMDSLYGKIRDSDPIVMATSLAVLEEVLKEEGGVVVNRAIAHHLLSHVKDIPVGILPQILTVLSKYVPVDNDEVFGIMNILDFCLTHNSPAVNITCLRLFLKLMDKLPHLKSEVFKRCQTILVSHLSPNNVEQSYEIISVIAEAPESALACYSNSFQAFFCHNKDPVYLRLKKIKILQQIVSEENCCPVMEEIGRCCLSESQEVSLASIQCTGQMFLQKADSKLSALCLQQLVCLMEASSPHILSNLFQVLQDLPITDRSLWEQLLKPVLTSFSSITDKAGKAAVLYLIGEHMRDSPSTLTILGCCIDDFSQLKTCNVKMELIDATTKMFLAHPFELQLLLGSLLEKALNDEDLEVNSRAGFIYRLLESGVDNAKAVLLGTFSIG